MVAQSHDVSFWADRECPCFRLVSVRLLGAKELLQIKAGRE